MMRVYEARQRAEAARRQLVATATELQERLRPATIASNAWEGVKDKSGELADDAVEAVKARPVAAASVLAAFTLFLARQPIKSAVSKLFAKEPDGHLVTTKLDTSDGKYDLTAPVAVSAEK
ncbi:MAG TPA: DUF3618 domain-containing protein [Allosphingosinicella sp.]|jgi:hypothetical protein|nr:DUF3618 domain-containing protein [Allosphingosinicella sp.]